MEAETGKGSLFGALRRASEPPLAPPPAQEPSLQPVLQRLEKIETQMNAGPGAEAGNRIAALEAQLKETQEQAVAMRAQIAAGGADSTRSLLLKRIDEILGRTAAQESLLAAAIQESRERQKAWEDRVAGELLGRILKLEEKLK